MKIFKVIWDMKGLEGQGVFRLYAKDEKQAIQTVHMELRLGGNTGYSPEDFSVEWSRECLDEPFFIS